MVKNKRALIISADQTRSTLWAGYIEELGWRVQCVSERVAATEAIGEFLPALMLLDLVNGERPVDIDEEFAQRCRDSGLAVIPILSHPTPEDIAVSFRRGAIDVLIEPFTETDIAVAIERSGEFKNLYQENMDYRLQLERANRNLRESLNTLRMDQLAGRQVQFSILPGEPVICRDYQVSHTIVPSLYLSGDFVGYNVVFDRYILFYFGDVSGHGASSAFVTVMIAFLLRQLRRRHVVEKNMEALGRAPQGLAEHVNRQLLAMEIDKHMTFFAGAIDVERNTLRYVVSALMPQPVLASQGKAKFLPGRGKPLGLVKDASWEIHELALPDKFTLVVASDGLLDCIPGESLEQKEASILSRVAAANSNHLEVCMELGVDDIKDAPDDVSVLTVTRGG